MGVRAFRDAPRVLGLTQTATPGFEPHVQSFVAISVLTITSRRLDVKDLFHSPTKAFRNILNQRTLLPGSWPGVLQNTQQ